MVCIASPLINQAHDFSKITKKIEIWKELCYAPLLDCNRPALRYLGTGDRLCRPVFRQAVLENQVKPLKKIKWTSTKAYFMFQRKEKKTDLSVVCIFLFYFDFSILSTLIIYANTRRKNSTSQNEVLNMEMNGNGSMGRVKMNFCTIRKLHNVTLLNLVTVITCTQSCVRLPKYQMTDYVTKMNYER